MQRNHILSVHWRLIAFAIAISVMFAVLFSLRTVLLFFVIGLLLAYVFRPLVVFLERKFPVKPKRQRIRRVIIIVGIFIIGVAAIILISAFFISTLINSSQQLVDNATNIVQSAVNTLQGWLVALRPNMPDSIKSSIDDLLNGGGSSLTGAIQTVASKTISFVPSAIGLFLGLAALPVFLFYLMMDWDRLGILLARGTSVWNVYLRETIGIVGRVVGRYFRGQLVLGAIVGTIVFIGMKLIGFPAGLAMALGFLSFIMEMVPVFGPWITLVIGIVVTLAFLPQKILWVIGLHVMIPILEGNFLVPRIQGEALNIHPALGLFILVLGTNLGGVWGIVIAFPFTATVMALYRYFIITAKAEDHSLEPASQANPVPP